MSKETKYDIDRLEWQQFEELSFKCLQEDITLSIDFIEGGNDKGRDAPKTKWEDSLKEVFIKRHWKKTKSG